jgi:RIO-like serine/threonine protein kinase
MEKHKQSQSQGKQSQPVPHALNEFPLDNSLLKNLMVRAATNAASTTDGNSTNKSLADDSLLLDMVQQTDAEAGQAVLKAIGRYEILRELGTGGMGKVYLGSDPQTKRQVAIKVLQDARSQEARQFQREAQVLARVEHPHIVTIYDWSEDQGRSFIVMQYIEGESLAKKLQRGRLPEEYTLTILAQVAEAVAYANEQGIIHRDLKPQNIMLEKSSGLAYVLDLVWPRT